MKLVGLAKQQLLLDLVPVVMLLVIIREVVMFISIITPIKIPTPTITIALQHPQATTTLAVQVHHPHSIPLLHLAAVLV